MSPKGHTPFSLSYSDEAMILVEVDSFASTLVIFIKNNNKLREVMHDLSNERSDEAAI